MTIYEMTIDGAISGHIRKINEAVNLPINTLVYLQIHY